MFPLESNNDFCGFVTGDNEIPFNTTTQLVSSRKLTFYDFLIKEEIKFINVCQYYNEKGKKEYKGKFTGWNNLTLQDLIIERDRRNNCENNSKFCRIENSPYVVVDIDIEKDTPEHNKCVNDIIKIYGGGVVFKSFSGKTHIWVKKHPEDKNKSNIIGWKTTPFGNVDIIYTGICELNTNELIDFGTLEHSCFTDYRKDTDLDRNIVVSDEILNSKLSNELIEYLELILNKYYENYNSWFALILAIYKITGDIDIADKYSQKASNYEEGVVEQKINSCKRFQFGEGTIRHYARESNLEKYNEIRARYVDFNDMEVTDNDLAIKALEECGEEIIYDSNTTEVYILHKQTNIWKKCGKHKREVKNLISKVLLPIVNTKLKKWKGKTDLDDKEKCLKKKWSSIHSKISNNATLSGIKEKVLDILVENENDYELDKKRPELFCFSNGKAMNLTTKQIVDIHPNDYITFTSGLPYKELTETEYNQLHTQFETITTKIFPDDDEQKESFHSWLRECLSLIKLEKFVMLTGEGRNGKGWYMNFLRYCMGDYFYTASKTLLTQPEKSGGDPQTAKIHLKRYVNVREPAENEKINISRVKELTGEVEINARMLNSNNTDCINLAKFGMECNLVPKTDEQPTNAFAQRLIIFTFVSLFTDNEEEVNEKMNIYLQDRELKKSNFLEQMRMYFLTRLLKHTMSPIFVPEKVKASAERLVLDNDKFFSWIEDNITILNDDVRPTKQKEFQYITFKDIVERYKQKFRDKYTSNQIKERLRMNIELRKRNVLSSKNPHSRKEGWCLIHCIFKTGDNLTY